MTRTENDNTAPAQVPVEGDSSSASATNNYTTQPVVLPGISDNVASETHIKFGVIAATDPKNLSKTVALGPDGTLRKTGGGQLMAGRVTVHSVANVTELADKLASLGPQHGVTWGVPDAAEGYIVTKAKLAHLKEASGLAPTDKLYTQSDGLPVMSRSREFFSYPSGPAVLMIDYDPQPDAAPMHYNELLSNLYKVCPALKDAPHLVRPSAGSYIWDAATNTEVVGSRGWRVLVAVADGTDIPRAGQALYRRCWLGKLGYARIHINGVLTDATIVDASAFQPERLDYCGGASCMPPLEQRRPTTMVRNADAAPLDTKTTLPSLPQKEVAEFDARVAEAKEACAVEADTTRSAYIANKVKTDAGLIMSNAMPRRGIPSAALESTEALAEHLTQRYNNALKNKRLCPDHQIRFPDGSVVTVRELLANPALYENSRCCDPVEPDYSDKRTAIIHSDTLFPIVVSFAHNPIPCRYRMERERERAEVVIRNGDYNRAVDRTVECITRAGELYTHCDDVVTVSDDGALVRMSQVDVARYCERVVLYVRVTEDGNVPVNIPRDVAVAVDSRLRQEGVLRRLRSVITAPTYNAVTDRIVDSVGYDASTQTWLHYDNTNWPGVTVKPTQDEFVKSIRALITPFVLYPFESPLAWGTHIAAMLTAVIRPLLPTAPATLYVAPTAGSGKTLLSQCVGALGGGRTSIVPEIESGFRGAGPDEFRKRLTALMVEGAQSIIFDNLTGVFESNALNTWLTADDSYSDRVLGASSTVRTANTRVNVVLNGNNVRIKGDLCRRTLVCRINPATEQPWKTHYPFNPLEYVKTHRLQLVAAAITILRYAKQLGAQLVGATGSFEAWGETVRRAVLAIRNVQELVTYTSTDTQTGAPVVRTLDVADPTASVDWLYNEDPEREKLRNFLVAVGCNYRGRSFTSGALVQQANSRGTEYTDVYVDSMEASIMAIAQTNGRGANARMLGRWLERNRDCQVEGLTLKRLPKTLHRAALWQIVGELPTFDAEPADDRVTVVPLILPGENV